MDQQRRIDRQNEPQVMDGLAGFQTMEDQPGAVGRKVAQVAFDVVEAIGAAVAAADHLARV
ncbi:hypothetical protein D3C87_1806470 [compost metagenome]